MVKDVCGLMLVGLLKSTPSTFMVVQHFVVRMLHLRSLHPSRRLGGDGGLLVRGELTSRM